MSFSYNADNIFEMAEEIERNGVAYYRSAAAKTSDDEVKELFISLSKMEVEHEKTFADMRAKLAGESKKSSTFDPYDEEAAYLKSLADMKVFYEKDIDMASPIEALKGALQAEKDSILFYLGMKSFVPENLGREWVDKIIDEEKQHIVLLTTHLSRLS